ncbi:hypothetical protein ANO14919_058280 [Xylariales sp. No.14919]|nr:hypothetical protein ANO14919_058280 [Xylariales sp. No.14919]
MAANRVPDPVTTNLKRKASRWQTRPPPGTDDAQADSGKYSLLLFLRDLDASPGKWDEFIAGLQDSPGAIDEKSTMAALLQAAQETQIVTQDYLVDSDTRGRDPKRRRLDLYGNQAAGIQMAEYDELINLARTVWTDPDNLRDLLGELYMANLGVLPGDPNYTLDKIFGMARHWGEVRYRFMNHALRDDPTQSSNYNRGRTLTKGNHANSIVHESNVLLDATVVQFLPAGGVGFNAQDRFIFQELYLLTPEEGRQLVEYTGAATGLRIGLPQVFDFCVSFINAYMDWRVRVLESARKQTLGNQTYRTANAATKARMMAGAQATSSSHLQAVDGAYAGDFLSSLRALLLQARTRNAFLRSSFDALDTAVNTMIREVRNCRINTATPDLRNNVQFNRMLNAFPGQGRILQRPTGTSMITERR